MVFLNTRWIPSNGSRLPKLSLNRAVLGISLRLFRNLGLIMTLGSNIRTPYDPEN